MKFVGAIKELRCFNQMVSEIDAVYHETAKNLGLSDSEQHILYAICNLGTPCLLSEIVRFSATSKQTINSAMRKMEREGILVLEAASGRKKQVLLTEKGEKLLQETVLQVVEIENEIYDEWSEEKVAIYLELTQEYLTTFREKTKNIKRREEV